MQIEFRKCAILKLKMLLEFGISFFQNSSIQGLNHIVLFRHPFEKFVWLGVVAGAVYSAAVLSSMTLTRYRENPTVISMERDRFSWNTSFPAATICPIKKIDLESLDYYLETTNTIENKTAFREFIISLSKAGYGNFEDVVDYDGVVANDYMALLKKFQFRFRPTISNSGLNGERLSLTETVTEMGICYGFNTHLTVYNSFDYWKNRKWNLEAESETFALNPLDGEVFANVVNMSSAFQVYIHGPYEVADVASKYIQSPDGYFLQLYLSALTLFSSKSIKSLTVQQRKCRFYDESDLPHYPVYSYVLCRMECRIKLANRLCGCTPHFYRKLDGERVCNVAGLHCLSKYKDRLTLLKSECSCMANCDEVNYVVEEMEGREWFLGATLQWGLKDYPKMRLRRDVLFGFSDLLVHIGGMAGLFLGCSVLSFIEIIYFFTLRLYWFIINYEKQVKK